MRKKLLSALLSVAMVLSLFTALPVTAEATSYACEIGGTGYATLAEALEAVTSGQTITLLADVTYNEYIVANTETPSFTIDLSGKNLSTSVGIGASYGKSLTITDSSASPGSFSCETSVLYGIFVGAGSSVVVNVPATLTLTGSGSEGIYVLDGGSASLSNAQIN